MPRLLASWFGTGLILRRVRGSDPGSGTVASLLTFPVAVVVGETWSWQAQVILLLATIAAGVWALRSLSADGDAAWIVVDEAAGTMAATIGLGWGPGLVAVIVFRIADITKRPFPGVSQAERLPGPAGVMADDLVAGLYGLVAGHLINALI
jgi:phosphatidylglycerophosphatase A